MRKNTVLFAALIAVLMITGAFHVSAAEVWDGTTITQPTIMTSVGDVYYYEIHSAEELAYISLTGGEWLGYNYMLMEDIVLNDTVLSSDESGNLLNDPSSLNLWTPIQNFTGTFDGNGHKISGLYVDAEDGAGFFSSLMGDLKNLTIENAYVRGHIYVGGICGLFEMVGKDMSDCYFSGTVVGSSCVGGLVGRNNCTNFLRCGNYGNVYATGNYVGGIVGDFYAYGISDCFNEGNIYSTGNYVAGIASRTDIYGISNCVNRGNVTGNQYVSGICAYIENAYISNCVNIGDIHGVEYTGGIGGYLTNYTGVDSWTADLVSCYNTGSITGGAYTGGMAGYLIYSNIDGCFNTGHVTGTEPTGALVGHSESVWGKGSITESWYLKNEYVNVGLNALGNAPDGDGTRMESTLDGLCTAPDGTINITGHIYSEDNPCDDTCNNCGYIRDVVHEMELTTDEDGRYHVYACIKCGMVDEGTIESHHGGMATCQDGAVCEICGIQYADPTGHVYNYGVWDYIESDGHGCTCKYCGQLDSVEPHEIIAASDPDEPDFCRICGYRTDGTIHDDVPEDEEEDDKKPDREEEDEEEDRDETDSDDESSVSILVCVLISAGTLTVGVVIGFIIGFVKGKKKR